MSDRYSEPFRVRKWVIKRTCKAPLLAGLLANRRSVGRGLLGRHQHRIDVMDDALRIEILLPWLLAQAAKRLLPILRKETALLLEKK